MFEYILAGFTGSFFSYWVVFGLGASFEECITKMRDTPELHKIRQKMDKIECKLNNIENKIQQKSCRPDYAINQ